VQQAVAYLLTWFLLQASSRPVLELRGKHATGAGVGSDAAQLATLTRLPAGLWIGVFLAVTCASAVLGTGWLLR
jgi:hypothetical protein